MIPEVPQTALHIFPSSISHPSALLSLSNPRDGGAQTPTSGPGLSGLVLFLEQRRRPLALLPEPSPKLLRSRVRVWKGLCYEGLRPTPLSHHHQKAGSEEQRKSQIPGPCSHPASGPCRSLLKPEMEPVSPAVGARSPYPRDLQNSWEIP